MLATKPLPSERDPAFFDLQLRPDALAGMRGFVRYHPAFDDV